MELSEGRASARPQRFTCTAVRQEPDPPNCGPISTHSVGTLQVSRLLRAEALVLDLEDLDRLDLARGFVHDCEHAALEDVQRDRLEAGDGDFDACLIAEGGVRVEQPPPLGFFAQDLGLGPDLELRRSR